MARRNESFFWTSFSDFMTSLFFVMMTLFVVMIVASYSVRKDTDAFQDELDRANKEMEKLSSNNDSLKKTIVQLRVSEKLRDSLMEAYRSTENLSKDYFEYKPAYKKYVLKTQVKFPRNKSDLGDISWETKRELAEAGGKIREFLNDNSETQYMVIIEGQASLDALHDFNYRLSYERAYSLVDYWLKDKNIDFGSNAEILICGSGDGSILPDSMKKNSMRESDESRNQRFLVQIIPKNIFDHEN